MATQDLSGRTVLITGAARGIGAACAARFHRRGANVALVGLEPERLEAQAAALGDRAVWFEADVCDGEALEAAVEGVVAAFGGIDVAVANAGLTYPGPLEEQPAEQWLRTIDVNLGGVYRTARAVLLHLIDSGGYFLAVSSLGAVLPGAGQSAYCASKAGIEALTVSLRQELLGTDATAGTAYFGFVDTDLVRGGFSLREMQLGLSRQPAFLRTPIAVSEAVDAIEHGVDRRAARVWAPWWVGVALWLRGVVQPLAEAAGRRDLEELITSLRQTQPDRASDDAAPDPILGLAVRHGVPMSEQTVLSGEHR